MSTMRPGRPGFVFRTPSTSSRYGFRASSETLNATLVTQSRSLTSSSLAPVILVRASPPGTSRMSIREASTGSSLHSLRAGPLSSTSLSGVSRSAFAAPTTSDNEASSIRGCTTSITKVTDEGNPPTREASSRFNVPSTLSLWPTFESISLTSYRSPEAPIDTSASTGLRSSTRAIVSSDARARFRSRRKRTGTSTPTVMSLSWSVNH